MQYDAIYARAVEVLEGAGLSEEWLNLGCETGSQNRLNRAYMDRFVFETRLIDAEIADTSTSLFEVPLSSPIIGSAISRGRVLENIRHESVPWFEKPPYLDLTAAALGKCGSLMGVGIVELNELASIASQSVPFYHIVKPYPDETMIRDHIEAAEELGAVAIGMDITPVFGHKAWNENPSFDTGVQPKTADQLRSYVESTELPFIVKGVLSIRDAQVAQGLGAAGIVISNHGGECIDYSRPILHALKAIRLECPDLTIIVDSGFRRGTDVLKAMCLGADAVAIATPLVVGFAAAGAVGVEAMYRAIMAELQRTMSACGFRDVSSIDSSPLFELS